MLVVDVVEGRSLLFAAARCSSVAAGWGLPSGKPQPAAGDILDREADSSDAETGLCASLFVGDTVLSSTPVYAAGDTYSAGASLIPKFRDHYVQTI